MYRRTDLGAMKMNRNRKAELGQAKGRSGFPFVRRLFVLAFLPVLLVTAAETQQPPGNVAGTWHVAIHGWKIQDHMLVLQQEGGAITGKFEFADVMGTVTGQKIAFTVHVKNHETEIAGFQGTISGDHMKGLVTKGKDSPLPGAAGTTQWTARRGDYK
jgi:hypothetical protein